MLRTGVIPRSRSARCGRADGGTHEKEEMTVREGVSHRLQTRLELSRLDDEHPGGDGHVIDHFFARHFFRSLSKGGRSMTTRSISRKLIIRLAAAILGLASVGLGTESRAGYITPNPGLPPQGGSEPPGYLGYPVTYTLPGLTIELFNVLHSDFTNIVVTTNGSNEVETFNSLLTGLVSINGGASLPASRSRGASKWRPSARRA